MTMTLYCGAEYRTANIIDLGKECFFSNEGLEDAVLNSRVAKLSGINHYGYHTENGVIFKFAYVAIPVTPIISKPKTLTPEEAWHHVQALWPYATGIAPSDDPNCLKIGFTKFGIMRQIAWPEGVTQWPPKQEQYREPTQDDVGKMVEVRNLGYVGESHWAERKLLAVLPSNIKSRFITSHNSDHTLFYCWEEARIKV